MTLAIMFGEATASFIKQNNEKNKKSENNSPQTMDNGNDVQPGTGNKKDREEQQINNKRGEGEEYVIDPNGDIPVKVLDVSDSDPDDQRLNRIPNDRENFLKRRIMLKNGQKMKYKLNK